MTEAFTCLARPRLCHLQPDSLPSALVLTMSWHSSTDPHTTKYFRMHLPKKGHFSCNRNSDFLLHNAQFSVRCVCEKLSSYRFPPKSSFWHLLCVSCVSASFRSNTLAATSVLSTLLGDLDPSGRWG